MFFDKVWYAYSVLIEGQGKNDHVVEEEGAKSEQHEVLQARFPSVLRPRSKSITDTSNFTRSSLSATIAVATTL